MELRARRQIVAWAALCGATLISFRASTEVTAQIVAIAASVALAAVKVAIVLRRFMDAGRLPLPMRLYFHGWAIGCAVMILGFAAATSLRHG